jgi:uncharacterized protein YutE (UPF0331/DUF86 family)
LGVPPRRARRLLLNQYGRIDDERAFETARGHLEAFDAVKSEGLASLKR